MPQSDHPPRPRRRHLPRTAALAALLAGALCLPTGGAAAEEPPELIVGGDFTEGTGPWWWTENLGAAVVDGALCAEVPGGTVNPWDAIIGQNDLPLMAGEGYELSFTATASRPATIRTNVQMATEPWATEHASADRIEETATAVVHTFTAAADHPAAQLVFQVGGGEDPFTLCLDDISLRGGAEPPGYEPDTGSPVRVNQVGYLPGGPKAGTVVTDADEPLTWTVHAPDGEVAATGLTEPAGVDPTSAQRVHTFDFSEVTGEGDGWTVTVAGETSEPFAIGGNLYTALRTDALAYFYHNRSGIEIDADLVGAEYARPAGHLGTAPNQGDTAVPCRPGECDYTLDVTGGWYDAGDHGKYVVNGGISVAQVMSQYERALTRSGLDTSPVADGTLAVPERGNGVPDILDEARWQLDFLMRMQVPEGEELAGMAHHKIHDEQWTGLPLLPHQDPQPRYLHPPSTAATLNLAAAAAQCARLFEPHDPDFADRCRTAALTAWDAARAHPDLLADPADGIGGGPYNDDKVSDEFYWAAAELYVTTGQERFRTVLLGSGLHGDTEAVFPRGGMNWAETAGLGALSLATVDNGLTAGQRADVRAMVLRAADGYAADAASAAYGVPYAPHDGRYVWGSNSQVLNNMVVLGTAHDLTGDADYRDAVLRGMDYLLGRNPLNQSYVTGYGERDSRNQHHRFWADQLNPDLPNPAPGSVAGGPNSDIQDPVAQRLLTGCAPAMCYVDDIESWSTNEITVNWNAPLAWVAAYLDDLGDGADGARQCVVEYAVHAHTGGFSGQVTVHNTGAVAAGPWELGWTFAGTEQVSRATGAELAQDGSAATATPAHWNSALAPDASVTFTFEGTGVPGGAPEAFVLNGSPCANR